MIGVVVPLFCRFGLLFQGWFRSSVLIGPRGRLAAFEGELGGQEKPDWLGGQQPDERGIDEKVLVTKKPE
ncbi:hypothetical protein T03_10187 [Trichinella britovi]|uniref:Uncharacterized protein n=1 Tax=Trichinella britovi TaxID=45882 RepID=A0A0V1C8V5_TRIBR|nr:hypothetical protein T03_10187 [Trichinella britovi]